MRTILRLGLILMAYSLSAGILLAFVYIKTEPIIQANKSAVDPKVLSAALPGMDGGYERKGSAEFPYYIGYKDAGKTVVGGYIFTASGKGYSSTIQTLVGVDTTFAIVGARVLSQQETPGLGDKVLEIKPGATTPWFTDQFKGLTIKDKIAVKKDGGTIDALTGATISSRAVSNSIQTGLKNMQAALTGGAIVVADTTAVPEEPEVFVLPVEDDLKAVLPGMEGGYSISGEGSEFPLWTGYRDTAKTTVGGYVVLARGKGFSSTVYTLVATDPNNIILNAKIIYMAETAGYGERMNEIKEGEKAPWFLAQFNGKTPKDNIAIKADKGVIDAITGATISSKGVTESIHTAMLNLVDARSGKTFAAWTGPTRKSNEPVPGAEQPMKLAEISPDDTTSTGLENLLWVAMPGMWGGYEEKKAPSGFSYWVGYRDSGKKEAGGYAFVAKGKGYASIIQTLVLTDAKGTITNTRILFQQEVAGKGEKILEIRTGDDSPWFTKQFAGKTADVVSLKADGGSIDAITGATVSSKGVTESVATGLKSLMQSIN